MENKNDKIIIENIQGLIDAIVSFQDNINDYYSDNPNKIDNSLFGDIVTTANYLQDLLEQLKNSINDNEDDSNGKARTNI